MLTKNLGLLVSLFIIIRVLFGKHVVVSPNGADHSNCFQDQCKTIEYVIKHIVNGNDTVLLDGGSVSKTVHTVNKTINISTSLRILKHPNSYFKPVIQYGGEGSQYIFQTVSIEQHLSVDIESVDFHNVKVLSSSYNCKDENSKCSATKTTLNINNSTLSGPGITLILETPSNVHITNTIFDESRIVVKNFEEGTEPSNLFLENVTFTNQRDTVIKISGFIKAVTIKYFYIRSLNIFKHTNLDTDDFIEPSLEVLPTQKWTYETHVLPSVDKVPTYTGPKRIQQTTKQFQNGYPNSYQQSFQFGIGSSSTGPKQMTTNQFQNGYPNSYRQSFQFGMGSSSTGPKQMTTNQFQNGYQNSYQKSFQFGMGSSPTGPKRMTTKQFQNGYQNSYQKSSQFGMGSSSTGPKQMTTNQFQNGYQNSYQPSFQKGIGSYLGSQFPLATPMKAVKGALEISSTKINYTLTMENVTFKDNLAIDTLLLLGNSSIDLSCIQFINNTANKLFKTINTTGRISDVLFMYNKARHFFQLSASSLHSRNITITKNAFAKSINRQKSSPTRLRRNDVTKQATNEALFFSLFLSSKLILYDIKMKQNNISTFFSASTKSELNFINGIVANNILNTWLKVMDDASCDLSNITAEENIIHNTFILGSKKARLDLDNININNNTILKKVLLSQMNAIVNFHAISVTENTIGSEIFDVWYSSQVKIWNSNILSNTIRKSVLSCLYKSKCEIAKTELNGNKGQKENLFLADSFSNILLKNISIVNNILSNETRLIVVGRGCNVTLESSQVVNNTAHSIARLDQPSHITLNDSRFENNRYSGYGFDIQYGRFTLVTCSFQNNTFEKYFLHIQALYFYNENYVKFVKIIGNKVLNGPLFWANSQKLTINDTILEDNIVSENIIKGVYVHNHNSVQLNSVFISNNTCFNVLWFSESSVELRYVRIAGNVASYMYTDIYVDASRAYFIQRQVPLYVTKTQLDNVYIQTSSSSTTEPIDGKHVSMLISAQHSDASIVNLTVNVTERRTLAFEISFASERVSDIALIDVYISCPVGGKPIENFITHGVTSVYETSCSSCTDGFYDSQSGVMHIIDKVIDKDLNGHRIISHFSTNDVKILTCKECPVGSVCMDGISKSRGNFYGYHVDGTTNIEYKTCPLNYCCSKDCPSHNTCQEHRQGILCGSCREGFYEDFFATKCVKGSMCINFVEFWIIFFTTAFTIVFCITTMDYIKEALAKMKQCIKKDKEFSSVSESEETDKMLIDNDSKEKHDLFSVYKFDKRVSQVSCVLQVHSLPSDTPTINRRFLSNSDSRHENQESLSLPTTTRKQDNNLQQQQYTISGILGAFLSFYQIKSLLTVQIPDHYSTPGKVADDQSYSFKDKLSDFFNDDKLSDFFNVDVITDFGSSFCPYVELGAIGKQFIKVLAFNTLLVMIIAVSLLICKVLQKVQFPIRTRGKKLITVVNVLGLGYIRILLFIYKNTASTSLVLLNCVDVDGTKVLYIQGDVECYTRWQYFLLAFLAVWVIPFPIALWSSYKMYRKYDVTYFQMMICLTFPPFTIWYFLQSRKEDLNSRKVVKSDQRELDGSEQAVSDGKTDQFESDVNVNQCEPDPRKSTEIANNDGESKGEKDGPNDVLFKKIIEMFEEPYRQKDGSSNEFVFWEHWRLIQRLILSAITTFVVNPLERGCFVLPSIITFALVYFKVRPFKPEMKLLHWLELVSLLGFCMLVTSNTCRGFLYVFNIPNQNPIPRLLTFFTYLEFIVSPLTVLLVYFIVVPIARKIRESCTVKTKHA